MSTNKLIRGQLVAEDTLESLRGWYPIAIEEEASLLSIWWRFIASQRFTQPFFDDTLTYVPREMSRTCRTPLKSLMQFSGIRCVPPSAFIFHSSRCGSTLLTQMLASLAKCIVISEAPVIDSVLQLCNSSSTCDLGTKLLSGVIRALGQKRFEEEQHLFIKLDSWHILQLSLIREVFPDTPCFFLYRTPVEIMLSHRRQRGMQMVPGHLHPDMLGIHPASVDHADLDGYCVQVLSRFLQTAEQHAKSHDVLLVNYNQLPSLIYGQFADIVSLTLETSDVQRMQARSQQHSKMAIGDFEEPRPEELRECHNGLRHLQNCYDELEQLRLSQVFS